MGAGWAIGAGQRRLDGYSDFPLRLCLPVSFAILLGATSPAWLAGQVTPAVEPQPLALPKYEVSEHTADEAFDSTGMGSHEEELRGEPFANDLTMVDVSTE